MKLVLPFVKAKVSASTSKPSLGQRHYILEGGGGVGGGVDLPIHEISQLSIISP